MKKDLFYWRKIATWCLYAAVAVMLSAAFAVRFFPVLENPLIIIGGTLIMAFLFINLSYWRCPSCGRRFPIRKGEIDSIYKCPYCFTRLREPTPEQLKAEEKRVEKLRVEKQKARQALQAIMPESIEKPEAEQTEQPTAK